MVFVRPFASGIVLQTNSHSLGKSRWRKKGTDAMSNRFNTPSENRQANADACATNRERRDFGRELWQFSCSMTSFSQKLIDAQTEARSEARLNNVKPDPKGEI